MGLCKVVILGALALLLQMSVVQGDQCNKRSIVVQLRMPQRVNLTIQYPEQKNPVNFVPYPYKQGNPSPSQCYTCRGSTCTKCNANSYTKPVRPATATKTNIVIDLRKQIPDIKNDNNNTKDGTVVVLEDDTRAVSAGGSLAIGKDGASAASSAATSATNSDIIATLNEQSSNQNQSPGNTEDIYVKDAAKASSGAAANAKDGQDNQTPQSPDQSSKPDEQPSKPDEAPSTDQNASPSDSSDPTKDDKNPSDSDNIGDKDDKDEKDDKPAAQAAAGSASGAEASSG